MWKLVHTVARIDGFCLTCWFLQWAFESIYFWCLSSDVYFNAIYYYISIPVNLDSWGSENGVRLTGRKDVLAWLPHLSQIYSLYSILRFGILKISVFDALIHYSCSQQKKKTVWTFKRRSRQISQDGFYCISRNHMVFRVTHITQVGPRQSYNRNHCL
jgi:hypothetical protein